MQNVSVSHQRHQRQQWWQHQRLHVAKNAEFSTTPIRFAAAPSTWLARLASLALMFAALLAVALVAIAFTPDSALAKSYTMPKVSIQAQAQTDGSLHVTEQRTFDFDGSFTAVWWTFEGLPSNAELQVNGVRMARIDADGVVTGEWTTLAKTSFNLSWRDEGGPGTDAYSLDAPQDTIYAFFHATDERRIIEVDYTVVNGVQAYADVAEVYWQYVGDQWAEASEDVTMTLALPVPQGTAVVAGDNVRAWGHGPLDGVVTVNADGTITYVVPKVNSGQYAEARVVFPVSWLTNLSGTSTLLHQNEKRLDTVLAEEQSWADQANNQRMFALAFVIACGVICALLIAWALRAYFKHGKELAPDFTDDYWRDVPDPAIHPAVIGHLWRWDRESQDDFTATLMHLAHKGALRIDKGSYLDLDGRPVDDYYLTRIPAKADALGSPLDRQAMDLLFDTVAKGRDSLWFGTIQEYGKDNPQEFVDAVQAWQGSVQAETNTQDFFEVKSKRLQVRMIAVAAVVAVAGVGVFLAMDNFIPLLFMLPTAIVLGVIANYMPRRTQRGNNLVAKCKALRNWLRDFSSLDERPPTDVLVWGEFMVYAYLFGIADKVMKELRLKVPELFEDEMSYMGTSYVPWWFWYSTGYGANGGVMPSVTDMLQTSVGNTVSTAQAAISAASGDSSSGGGFGGGFSMGGGGGFGGGGGAR